MIRKATPHDLKAVTDLCFESLKQDVHLRPSRERVRALARECISGAPHFAWVAESDSAVNGVLLSITHPNMAYERSCATVVMLHFTVAGDDAELVSKFLQWARTRSIIKRIVFDPEVNLNPLVAELLIQHGLKATPTYTETR